MEASNMDHVLAMNLWIFLCSLVGSVYGLYFFYKKSKALFLKLAAGAVFCAMFARLFPVIYMVTQEPTSLGDFHVGILGIIGSFMFFFSANFGQMDSLVDDGSRRFLSSRLIALTAPAVALLLYLGFFFNVADTEARIVQGVVTFFIMQCVYYNCKHVVIYDVEGGIIRALRRYNLLVLAYAFLSLLEPIGFYLEITPLYIASCVSLGIVTLCLLPVLKGGAEKWTI